MNLSTPIHSSFVAASLHLSFVFNHYLIFALPKLSGKMYVCKLRISIDERFRIRTKCFANSLWIMQINLVHRNHAVLPFNGTKVTL